MRVSRLTIYFGEAFSGIERAAIEAQETIGDKEP
jgi:hypothetical protein